MASGDTLLVLTPLHNEPPSANAATIDLRNQHAVLDFDAATDESAVFGGVLPRNYAGGGVTITLVPSIYSYLKRGCANVIDAALGQGLHDLEGRSYLNRLLTMHRGLRNSKNPPRFYKKLIIARAKAHHHGTRQWL